MQARVEAVVIEAALDVALLLGGDGALEPRPGGGESSNLGQGSADQLSLFEQNFAACTPPTLEIDGICHQRGGEVGPVRRIYNTCG